MLVRKYRIVKIRLYMGSIIPILQRFLTRIYHNFVNFGLGRRINFSAIRKVNVPTIGGRILLNAIGGVLISIGATMVILA